MTTEPSGAGTADAGLTVIDDLLAASPIPDAADARGLGHTTALKSPDARVVVLAFRGGHTLKEHTSPHPLLMQALDGELLVRAGGVQTRLRPGGLIRLDAALRHEVEAVVDSRLMLTLLTK